MITPRPAATLILTRDTPSGIEVFMMQRTHKAVFMPGVFVFPGGAVDAVDASEEVHPHIVGIDDREASRMLGVERGGLAYMIAALRECFEESGLLLAHDERGEYLELCEPDAIACYSAFRKQVNRGELSLAALCGNGGLKLRLDGLVYFSHWITPPGPPRRYDTRFFIAVAPASQEPSHDGEETVDHVWIRPDEALERNRRGEFPLSSPTIRTLKSLAAFPTTEALMTHARSEPPVPTAERQLAAMGRDGRRLFGPGEPPYAEISKLDPEGYGTASYEILPGIPTRLSPTVFRIAAPNASVMTGPGTNTYLVGSGDDWAVVDPGPDMDAHLQSILQAAPGKIRHVLVTHTHRDHSPGAARLKAETGAEVLGMPAPDDDSQDHDFNPDRVLAHGERLPVGGCTLRVLHTPGHASNHLCFLHEEEQILFSGDHVMQGSTVVINPPDGDMGAYLRSLDALHREDIAYIAPGHGFLIGKPHEAVDRIVSHRLAREGKVMQALRQAGSAREEELLPVVYGDVPRAIHRIASRSLLAHLLKLRDDGVALRDGDRWTVASSESSPARSDS